MTNCRPERVSTTPVTAQELRALRNRLSAVADTRRSKAARAEQRASNAVTPIGASPQPEQLSAVSATLRFPVAPPPTLSFSGQFLPNGVRLTGVGAVSSVDIVSPEVAQVVGIATTDASTWSVHFECRNVVRDGADSLVSVVVQITASALNPQTAPITLVDTPGQLETPTTVAGAKYYGVTLRKGDIALRVGAGAGVTRVDVTVEWFSLARERLANGYPSFLRGWDYGGDPSTLGITRPPQPARLVGSTEYEVDPRQPYGTTWTTVRPAGWPINGPLVATKDASRVFISDAITQLKQIIQATPTLLPITSIPSWEIDLDVTLHHLAEKEGGGRMWAPQQRFDVRPIAGSEGSNTLRLDEGPFPRTNGRKTVDSAYRPAGTEPLSPIGPFQMNTATFRGETARRRALLAGVLQDDTDYSDKFLWDAPITYQLLLQMLKLAEEVWLPTALLGERFPPLYRAMAAYVVNGLSSPGRAFIAQAVAAVSALPPNATSLEAHIACKTVWDSGTGEPGTWPYFNGFRNRHWNILCGVGDKMALNPDSLRAKHPTVYDVPPAGLPAPRKRRED